MMAAPMAHALRIAVFVLVLVGSAAAFGLWARQEMNLALSDLDRAYVSEIATTHTRAPFVFGNQLAATQVATAATAATSSASTTNTAAATTRATSTKSAASLLYTQPQTHATTTSE